MERLYTFDRYWHKRMKCLGYPTIEDRTSTDLNDGRTSHWLELVQQYGPSSGQVAEVGCAHGVLLAELARRGYRCTGNEPDEVTASWTREKVGLDIRSGFFPEVALPECDLFIAFDVLEHSIDPKSFMIGASKLLKPGGVAVIQTPIDRYDYEPPFGETFEAAFNDIEHLYILTDESMEKLAECSGLEIIDAKGRLWLHHEICIFQKH